MTQEQIGQISGEVKARPKLEGGRRFKMISEFSEAGDQPTAIRELAAGIQGQEREVVVLSLATGDPAESKRGSAFHLSLNRLNVALSRARTKAILVGSAYAFQALPADAAGLRMASRCKELRDRMVAVDLSSLYVIN